MKRSIKTLTAALSGQKSILRVVGHPQEFSREKQCSLRRSGSLWWGRGRWPEPWKTVGLGGGGEEGQEGGRESCELRWERESLARLLRNQAKPSETLLFHILCLRWKHWGCLIEVKWVSQLNLKLLKSIESISNPYYTPGMGPSALIFMTPEAQRGSITCSGFLS